MSKIHTGLLSAAFVLLGCGGETNSSNGSQPEDAVQNEPSKSFAVVVEAAEDMPVCNPENNRQLVFIAETSQFQTCNGVSWTAIDIKGEKGDAGEAGAAGEPGVAGVAGEKGETGDAAASVVIEKVFSCSTLSADIGIDDFRYGIQTYITQYSNGSYAMSCMSGQYEPAETGMDTSSFSSLFPADSTAVVNGELGCVPLYVSAIYSISANAVTYENQADPSYNDTIACLEVYPGN